MRKKLKILFISFNGDIKDTTLGFVKKDIEKVEALNSIEDTICKGVSFSSEIEKDYNYSDNFSVVKLPSERSYKFFGSWMRNIEKYKYLTRFLDAQVFDVLIFRYTLASVSLFKFTKRYKNKIVFEHNTFEYDEEALWIKSRRSELKFSLKPGYFLYYIEGKLWPLFCEKYLGPKIRSFAKAGISVTNEIARYQESLTTGYKNQVITNGIKYKKDLIHEPAKFNGSELKLFMLLGTGGPWHGVDRILNGLADFKGKIKIQIDIIGYYDQADVVNAKKLGLDQQVFFIEPITIDELNKIINKYHLAIGTLAVHRKNLKEATPLKVRESLMRGFPTIIAYEDTDFKEPSQLNNFILKLPADDTPIDFNVIQDFAERSLIVPNYPTTISGLAQPIIDYSVKAKKTVDFINSLS